MTCSDHNRKQLLFLSAHGQEVSGVKMPYNPVTVVGFVALKFELSAGSVPVDVMRGR